MLAKALAQIGPEIEIPFWQSSITITLGLPFSWKMFYFSAIGFAFASFLYSMRCPAIIRDYDRFSDFEQEGKGSTQLIGALSPLVLRPSLFEHYDHRRWLENFINRFCELPRDPPTDFLKSHRETYEVLDQTRIRDSNLLPDAFWVIRSYADRSSPLPRMACGLFYLVAFVFVLIVLGQNFLYVWTVVF